MALTPPLASASLSTMNESDVLIVGAGIAGLLCATELQQAGLQVRLVDKGRGVGGRMATRRMGGGRLDHGAQFFTARDERFQTYVREWLDHGVIREWYRNANADTNGQNHIRYCGVTGMSDAPKYLARKLDVCCAERIQLLSRKQGQWIATSESGQVYCARELVITAPLPQALQLLDSTDLDYAGSDLPALRQIAYAKGLALLAILDGPSGIPLPGAIKLANGEVDWIADNQLKGISPDGVVGVTVHATAAFAEEYWDTADAVRGPLLITAVQKMLQSNIVEYKCHRWGFTHPLHPWPAKYYRNAEINLTLAGDAFGGPRVESAALSGLEAATQL